MALPDLTDQFISDSYKGMLHTSNTPVDSSNKVPVFDGLGNKTALNVGKDGVHVSGTLSTEKLTVEGFNTIIDYLYPVNSVYLSFDDTNPQSRFTGTSWEQISQGRFLVGVGTGVDVNSESVAFISGNDIRGVYSVKLTTDQIPTHNHLNGVYAKTSADNQANGSVYGISRQDTPGNATRSIDIDDMTANSSQGFTSNVGGSNSHTNIPPSYGIYVWRRIG